MPEVAQPRLEAPAYSSLGCYWFTCSCPLRFLRWVLAPNVMVWVGGAFGRRLRPEGRTVVSGMNALMKVAPERSIAPPALWGYGKKEAMWTRKQALPRHQIYWHCGLGFLRIPNYENTCCSQATQSVELCYSHLNGLRHRAVWMSAFLIHYVVGGVLRSSI